MIEEAASWLVGAVGIDPFSPLGSTIVYFLYDSVKILLLLFFAILLIGTLRTFISAKRLRAFLAKRSKIVSHAAASLFGAVTPFCSCSSIPIYVGFLEAGVPLGVALSFLVTSPLVNEYMAVLMLIMFGWRVMVAYVVIGILLGIIVGMVLGRMRMERYLVKNVVCCRKKEARFRGFGDRIRFGNDEAIRITKKIWLWVLGGVLVGAIIHNYVPQPMVEYTLSKGGIFTVPLAVLIGVPLYGSSSALVPVAQALFAKGVPLGTTLAFIMAVAALSMPEAIILRRIMKTRFILVFFAIVAAGIILVGYLLNALQPLLV
jgi:hypothetical protein